MGNEDGSDWFTGSPRPLENSVQLAQNFLEPAIMQAIHEECRGILGTQPTGDLVNDAVAAAISIAEKVWGDLEAESPPFACEKGCAWCCHQTVMVIAPEVLFVRAHINREYSVAEIGDLRRKLTTRTG